MRGRWLVLTVFYLAATAAMANSETPESAAATAAARWDMAALSGPEDSARGVLDLPPEVQSKLRALESKAAALRRKQNRRRNVPSIAAGVVGGAAAILPSFLLPGFDWGTQAELLAASLVAAVLLGCAAFAIAHAISARFAEQTRTELDAVLSRMASIRKQAYKKLGKELKKDVDQTAPPAKRSKKGIASAVERFKLRW